MLAIDDVLSVDQQKAWASSQRRPSASAGSSSATGVRRADRLGHQLNPFAARPQRVHALCAHKGALGIMLDTPKRLEWSAAHLALAVQAAGVALWSWNVDDNSFAMDRQGFE